MAKKIRREVMINGTKRWVSGNNEQEYAENLVAALAARAVHELQFAPRKHNFRTYSQKWFEVFSNDCTKDIKQAQAAAGHTTAAMTLKHYVKGRQQKKNSAAPIASIYRL